MDPFYITTPIYYLNGRPHLGHAYTTIVTDVLRRFWELWGRDTYFLTGTDEHGQKIAEAASQAGQDPNTFVDEANQYFRDMTALVGARPDDFIRTTEPRHVKGARALWDKIAANGWIEKGTYAGWYAVRDEAFYKESDIVDGKAPTGAHVAWVEEPCYFFKLSAFQERLLAFYKHNPDFVVPKERFNEAIRWVEQGLQDLAISRSTFNWGIPVPGADGHIMYVWMDALSNYITALGYPDHTEALKRFWPGATHVIGKDILRFHAIYWPAFLMAADMTPPKQLYVHGWWTVEGEKMSKSLGNVLSPEALVNIYGLDPLRYFLLRQMPLGSDGNFSESAFEACYTAELANDLGNLFQRVLAFIHKRMQKVPSGTAVVSPEIDAWLRDLPARAEHFMTRAQPHNYLAYVWEGVSLGNRFFDMFKPWMLYKSDQEVDKNVLNDGLAQILSLLYSIALYLQPVMPEMASNMLKQMGYEGAPLSLTHPSWRLTAEQPLPEPNPLFSKEKNVA